jgi:hypothetical protein
MSARLARACRSGAQTALVVLLLQATAVVALATSLPEVGHVHPAGTPDHPHALLEVGGAGVPAPLAQPLPRPAVAQRRSAIAPLAGAPRPRAGRTRLGRDPPAGARHVGRFSPT